MQTSYLVALLALTAGLPLLGLAMTAPTLLVLFGAAYTFSSTRNQRMANLICGFAFAVAVPVTVVVCLDRAPNSWADKNSEWILFGGAPIGAALGVAAAVGYRHAC